jgi:hypothetical protein
MKTFQLVRNGKRIARLTVNCRATSAEIAEACISAAMAFKVAHRWEKIDGQAYCGMETYEGESATGAQTLVYEVEEGESLEEGGD